MKSKCMALAPDRVGAAAQFVAQCRPPHAHIDAVSGTPRRLLQ